MRLDNQGLQSILHAHYHPARIGEDKAFCGKPRCVGLPTKRFYTMSA